MRTLKPFFPFDNPFPAAFKGIMPAMVWDEATPPPAIKLDVVEGEKEYTVKAEIPGVAKEDIYVDVDGPVVTLCAEVRRENSEKEEGKVLRIERFQGMLSRTFTLPLEIKPDSTKAIYADGVLTLTLPKKLGAPSHRVMVN
jgi:HSP20 family protein